MDFAEASAVVSKGGRVYRAGWTGKDLVVYLMRLPQFAPEYVIVMTSPSGGAHVWTPTAEDKMAVDWYVPAVWYPTPPPHTVVGDEQTRRR